jgi:diadenosine tetraphosphate (Ap4A) HIT family hydrolase
MPDDCLLCDGERAARELNREIVWEDELWRLSMTHRGYTTGFGYLEPKRHVPHITDLDGDEAATFGSVVARVASALKEAAGAELVYVYVFGGGIPHLHVHLGPHREGDPLSSAIIRGEFTYEPMPSGAQRVVSRDFAELATDEIATVIERARILLSGTPEAERRDSSS